MHGRACLFAILLGATAAAGAESPAQSSGTTPSPGPGLTLAQAVSEAMDHNLALVAERYSIDVARARILGAGLRPNPVFTYNVLVPDRQIYDNNINPLENVFRVDWLVEGGGKRARRLDVANQALSVAELQFLNVVRTTRVEVEDAFLDVLLAEANLSLARESLEAFTEIVRLNAERVRTGDLAPVELSRTRLAALQLENDVKQQESRSSVARNRLRTLIGRRGGDAIDVAGDFRRDPQPPDLEALRHGALADRPDLQALRRDEARSVADIRLQLAQGRIDYTISGEYHDQRAPSVVGAQYGVYVSVPVPIFNRNQGEVARARQESKQLDARVRALEEDVLTDVGNAFEECQTALDVVQRIETQMLARAREVRSATEYAYRRGDASFIEFLDAVRAFNDTMQGYNQARADYARSLYALDAASGRVNP